MITEKHHPALTVPQIAPSHSARFIEQGGTLDYALGSVPNPAWDADAHDAPPFYV